jgi:hypothetical protein
VQRGADLQRQRRRSAGWTGVAQPDRHLRHFERPEPSGHRHGRCQLRAAAHGQAGPARPRDRQGERDARARAREHRAHKPVGRRAVEDQRQVVGRDRRGKLQAGASAGYLDSRGDPADLDARAVVITDQRRRRVEGLLVGDPEPGAGHGLGRHASPDRDPDARSQVAVDPQHAAGARDPTSGRRARGRHDGEAGVCAHGGWHPQHRQADHQRKAAPLDQHRAWPDRHRAERADDRGWRRVAIDLRTERPGQGDRRAGQARAVEGGVAPVVARLQRVDRRVEVLEELGAIEHLPLVRQPVRRRRHELLAHDAERVEQRVPAREVAAELVDQQAVDDLRREFTALGRGQVGGGRQRVDGIPSRQHRWDQNLEFDRSSVIAARRVVERERRRTLERQERGWRRRYVPAQEAQEVHRQVGVVAGLDQRQQRSTQGLRETAQRRTHGTVP